MGKDAYWKLPVGSGPHIVTQNTPREKIVLDAFNDYNVKKKRTSDVRIRRPLALSADKKGVVWYDEADKVLEVGISEEDKRLVLSANLFEILKRQPGPYRW
jgi:hypothetical protein